MQIVPGSRCQIVSVHHRCFSYLLGRVVDHDPRCIQPIYGLEQLRLLPYGSLDSY